jgi:succinate dehydrogenase assembly factor 2
MRRDYDAMPARFAPHAQPPPGTGPGGGGGGGGGEVGVREAFRKRLLYRSKQRGWLEVDLLLGTWAELHLAALPEELLPSYERILNRETLDIFNMITGKEAPPAELEGPVMDSIKRFVAKGGQRFVGPEGYAAIKGGMSN